MDNIARELLKVKLQSLNGTAFQDKIDKIFLIIYGDQGFVRIKQKRDKGSDGILEGDTILAVYAPESYSLRGFKAKINLDYNSYENNWEDAYPKWIVVTNLESTAEMVMFVNLLKEGSSIICIEKLLEIIRKQTWTRKSSIFTALDVPDKYLSNNVLSVVVEDLISTCDDEAKFCSYEKPTYIETKIGLNIDQENIDTFLSEYEDSLAIFSSLQHVIQSNSSGNIAAIRGKITRSYTEFSGTFEERLALMVKSLSGDKFVDDYYTHYLRVVLIYFFEQCLFGKKVEGEKK